MSLSSNLNETRIRSWMHLQAELFADSWQEDIRRHRSPYAFRGSSRSSYQLSTTLQRLGGTNHPEHGPKLESIILRSFKKYAYSIETKDFDEWYWLSVAQHHGLPTRLLDWTTSPLVALHFATEDLETNDEDAAVWCVDVKRVHDTLPPNFRKVILERHALIFTAEMLRSMSSAKSIPESELPTLYDYKDYPTFLLFFEPPSLTPRIVNQFGYFSIMSKSNEFLDDWLRENPHMYKKLIIPNRLKWEIRNKIDQMNITERVLFPGLDGLSRWLKRYYSHYPEGAEDTGGIDVI